MLYREGYKYQVAADEFYPTPILPAKAVKLKFLELSLGGILRIREGYAWDGASGPTIDKGLTGWLTDTTVPSCVHDAFAQLLRLGRISPDHLPAVNELLDKMLKRRGMWWIRRRVWMRGLWLTGGSFADPDNVKPVLEAP
jgi:hypothetical protein